MPSRLALLLVFLPLSPALAQDLCDGYRMRERRDSPAASPYQDSFLWRASKPGLASSYILGSFHSSSDAVRTRWESLLLLMGHMRSFATETGFSPADRSAFARLARGSPSALPEALGRDYYPRAREILRAQGLSDEAITQLKPWAAFLQMAQPRGQGQSLDSFLYSHAARLPLRLVPLQSPREMAESAEAIALADQVRIVKETTCNHPAVLQQVERLERLYSAGDVPAFLAESERLESPESGLTGRLREALVQSRNRIFLPRLQPLLAEGGALVVVGAGHLYGKAGLLQAIEAQGYSLEAIDGEALPGALLAQASEDTAVPLHELVSWLRAQGLGPPPDALRIRFVPTPELERAACGGPCQVLFHAIGGEVLASVEAYHGLRQREPGMMTGLLSTLVQGIHAIELGAAGACSAWSGKNVENMILQGKYLESRGQPGAVARPPLPRNCR